MAEVDLMVEWVKDKVIILDPPIERTVMEMIEEEAFLQGERMKLIEAVD